MKRVGVVLTLALCALAMGASAASADEIPAGNTGSVSEVGYTSAHLTGTVNPFERLTYYGFEYSTDQENWTRGPSAYYGGNPTVPANSGPTEVSEDLTGLKGGTEYFVRIGTYDEVEFTEHFSEAPYLSFTTDPVSPPSASIDPVTAVTASGSHFSGHVDPEAPAGDPAAFDVHWEFKCTPECPGLQGGTVTAAEGEQEVEADATGLEPNVEYEVELIATNVGGSTAEAGPEVFKTDAVPPSVETIPAFALGNGTAAVVGGRVNPKNSATTYWIEYGTDESYGSSFPVSEDADAGSGGEAQIVTQELTGLTAGTEYHFRIVAESAAGKDTGEDMNFESTPPAPAESCPNAQLRAENNSTALPDCRAYEQVSPVDKNGYDAETQGGIPVFVAAQDGSALAFESFGAFAEPASASFLSGYLSKRGDNGWATQALNPPQLPTSSLQNYPTIRYFTPDLSKTVLGARGPALAPGATPGVENFYLRDNVTGTYETLNLEGSGEYFFAASSKDARHILFESTGRLTPDAPPGAEINLYKWSDGQLELVTIGPDGAPIAAGGSMGGRETNVATTHAISEDGSRAVFRSDEGGSGKGQLYLREDGHPTVEISASRRSTPDPDGQGTVRFVGASADTSLIYFLSTEALTDDAPLGGVQSLYRYDVEADTLTNLAVPLSGVAQVEAVPTVSDDGSSVYFYAKGRFVAGQGEAGRPGLYLWHNGTISAVAVNTSPGDQPTWANVTTYRLSPNARYLTFSSSDRLTAYENADALTGGADNEVYRYDAAAKRLTCVSCNPDGLAPYGSSGVPGPPARPQRNLQPGASDAGNLFFNSSDALVPADVNGKEDVYEWKDGRLYLISPGAGGDASSLASTSQSGEDAFFATRAQLIPADRDQLLDIYDAHVVGGFPQPTHEELCETAETCHGSGPSAAAFADPASGAGSGATQLSPRARRLKAALKACRKKPKKARARCRSKAKKHFVKAGGAH